MAQPNSNFDQISAITERYFMPKLTDNIFKTIPLFSRMKDKIELVDGGTQVLVPLNYAQTSATGWYSGADTLNNADNDIISSAQFDWKQIYASVPITKLDELKNSGQAAKVNFVKSKMQVAEKTIRDVVATGLWNAGTTPNAILGMRSFLSTTATYGGISQSTYSFWQANIDATTTTTTIGALQTQWSLASLNGESPTVLLSGSGRYDAYYNLLQPQQRFMDSKTAEGGFQSLMYNGVPWIVDSKAPSTHVVMLNEDYVHLLVHKDENFKFEPFQKPINQNLRVAHIFATMVFASSNNRMHAALTALTA